MALFKDAISPEMVDVLAGNLAAHLPDFERHSFTEEITADLPSLELKERINRIAGALHTILPEDAASRNRILLAILHPDPLDQASGESSSDGMCGWGIWPLTTVIECYGLADRDRSLATLREITKRGTAEFAVRPFIAADPEETLAVMTEWTQDENHHVRRLASEGTRPRLPWGMRLDAIVNDPSLTLPILTALRDDPSEYVRRSVANHLNDIAKDHPDLVADIAADWLVDASTTRRKLVGHACRTLIKQGHARTLAAFGISAPRIEPPDLRIDTPEIALGDALVFQTTITSTGRTAQTLIVDYIINHRKANGTVSPKVFKWTKRQIAPGESLTLDRRHPIRAITTRTYYAGRHFLSLRINGEDFGMEAFDLTSV